MLKTLTLLFLFLTVNITYGQESKLTKPQEINSNEVDAPIETPTVIENSVTKTYLVKNEEYYNKFITALKGKKEHMLNDSNLNLKAESLDWYTKINAEIEKAENQLQKLRDNEK